MGMVSFLAKKIFNKIFTNLAKELDAPVGDIQIGIYYANNKHKFEVYQKKESEINPGTMAFVKIKDIELDDYVGACVDFSGGTAVVEATIAQSGPKYAKELGCATDDISIIMQYNELKGIPDAVLLNAKTKVRKIDIEEEFLSN